MGFEAVVMATVDGRGFVVMTNSQNGGRLAGEIAMSFAAAYGWPDRPQEREAIAVSPEALAKFAGEYQSDRLGKVRSRVEGDHLVINIASLGDVKLYPESPTTFFSVDGVPDLKFAADASAFTIANATAKRVR